MGKYKVVVAHPYKQHSFELAEGLRRKGILYKYITTVYYKKNNLTGFVAFFLKGQQKRKALSRVDERIDSYVIQFCEGEGLIKLLTMKVPFLAKYYESIKYHSNDRFAMKVVKFCLKKKVDAVVVYDDTTPLLAEKLKEKNPEIKVVLDMSAPALPYLSNIYKEDMNKSQAYAEKMRNEVRKALNPNLLNRSQREITAADYFLVASEFTKKSLVECGVDQSKIAICPYGIDHNKFSPGIERNGEILHAVFIGGTKQYKGISYLLEAFKNLEGYPVDLTIIGENTLNREEIPTNVKCTGIIMHDEVAEVLKKCDFAIFPSLGDGFGFGVTEALSAGCPVICSLNAGAVDLIEDGYNGFRVKAQSSQDILDRVVYLLNNRDMIYAMQENARKSITHLTWEQYYQNVGDTMETLIST